MFKKSYVLLLVVSLLAFGLAACGSDETNGESKGTLKVAMPPWVNSPPQAYLAKFIIEDHYGWDVDITEADIGLAYASTFEGTTDFFVDGWLPDSHKSYVEEYADGIQVLDPFTEVPPSGLAVPTYVDIDSIEELNSVKDKFDGKIVGIEPGAGIMEATKMIIDEYGLDFELQEGSDFAMTAALGDAIDNNEWIVIPAWTPHWIFSKFDLKFIDDPKELYGTATIIVPIVHKGLEEKAPEVVQFLNDWKVDEAVWNELIMATAIDEQDPEIAVRAWMDENPDIVDSWVKK